MSPIKIFYSYSHADAVMMKKLDGFLRPIKEDGVTAWFDGGLTVGQEFSTEIKNELNSSDIILLLISSDFLNSDYCREIEMTRAMERHELGEAIVIPVLLSDCLWKKAPFAKLLMAPYDAKAIDNPKNWATINEAFTDVATSIEKVVEDIKGKKNKDSSDLNKSNVQHGENIPEVLKVESETIHKAVDLFIDQSSKVNYSTSKEGYEKIEKLRAELLKALVGELDEKIKNIPSLRNAHIEVLFDKIYTSEVLEEHTIQEIQKIRRNSDNYQWYEKKVIVSSITLSLLSSKSVDQQKVNLLIDFLTEFEDGVWESALIGIVISLLYHQNKWWRFETLKKRLSTLRDLERVQDGLIVIERILRDKLYAQNAIDHRIYSAPFFNTPLNCFLPFYENNPALKNALDNNATDIDPERFFEYVTKLPFLDCHKYALCLAIEKGTAREIKLERKEIQSFTRRLNIAYALNPYQNLVSEVYNFFTYYPKQKIEDVFKSQKSITETKLKSIILDKTNELRLTADKLIDDENYHGAILTLSELLVLEPNHLLALWNISSCYLYQKKSDYKNALIHLVKLNSIDENNLKVLLRIGECYFMQDKYNKALEFYNKALVLYPEEESVFRSIGNCYYNMKEYEKAIEMYKSGHNLNAADHKFLNSIANAYTLMDKNDLAIEFLLKAIAVCPKDKLYKPYSDLCSEYCDIEDFDNGLKYGFLAVENGPKEPIALTVLGRAYLVSGGDLRLARKYLEKANSIKSDAITFGNLGHLELVENNVESAVSNYKKCITRLIDDMWDFEQRYDRDFHLLEKYGVNRARYMEIKRRVIEEWRLGKKTKP